MLLHHITDQSLSVLSWLLRCWKYLGVNVHPLISICLFWCPVTWTLTVALEVWAAFHSRCSLVITPLRSSLLTVLTPRQRSGVSRAFDWMRGCAVLYYSPLLWKNDDGKTTFSFYSSAYLCWASSQQKSFCWIVLEKTKQNKTNHKSNSDSDSNPVYVNYISMLFRNMNWCPSLFICLIINNDN